MTGVQTCALPICEIAPEKALLVAGADDLRGTLDRLGSTAYGKLWNDPSLAEEVKKLKDSVEENLKAAAADAGIERDSMTWPASVGVAVMAEVDEELGLPSVQYMFFCDWASEAEATVKMVDALVARGIRGVKIHPAIQILGPDHPRMIALCRACGARNLPVLFHCGPVGIDGKGARRRTQVDRYRAALEACPETTFVLGHAGALQHERAIALARQLPNVWVEIASQSLPVVRQLLDEVDPTRICFGSDWPFYHQGIGLAKVLIATEGRDDVRRMVLHDNAARLLRRQ